ncbi:uncharacterized protein LOC114575979 [Exaiptasia diaphana]|uniref:Uncharacterized protein n=1 Tax=Exaiptasia diaphana TaxID=2652724 RepID=A0A913YR67_EXADI|nr:uncharacterized protein LOC114575979 [Exaiptasia diaphana]XP_028517662.1 uncharacterized protein LOC114575979 [Exaiptasia diaphana]
MCAPQALMLQFVQHTELIGGVTETTTPNVVYGDGVDVNEQDLIEFTIKEQGIPPNARSAITAAQGGKSRIREADTAVHRFVTNLVTMAAVLVQTLAPVTVDGEDIIVIQISMNVVPIIVVVVSSFAQILRAHTDVDVIQDTLKLAKDA